MNETTGSASGSAPASDAAPAVSAQPVPPASPAAAPAATATPPGVPATLTAPPPAHPQQAPADPATPAPAAPAASAAERTASRREPHGRLPDWEKRYRAPRVGLPEWAEDAPERNLYVSDVTGTYELYAWDRRTGERRQVTDRPNGTTDGTLSRDGEWVWWFSDTNGDEFGVWMRQPFGGGEDIPAAPGLAPSYPAGVALGVGGVAVVGRSTDDEGTTVHVVPPDGAEPYEIYRHEESAGVGDLSEDGTLVVIEHTEHGDAMHSALRVLRVADGSVVAELDDTEGGVRELGLDSWGFAPVPGDPRLLVGHQRSDRWLPLIWDVASGEQTLPSIDLPGDVQAEWYPDAGALLLVHDYHARSELFRYDLADGTLTALDTPRGSVGGATSRPDGTVEYLWSSAERPPAVRSTTGAVVLEAAGLRAPDSVPVEDVWVEGPGGLIHALVQRPPTAGPDAAPLPTVFEVHGGPTWHESDSFAAGPAAWLDHGFAVVRVNYRGSTGYGREWTDALKHRVGLIELEDITAVRAWAVESGLADPARLVLTGGSWGGYLTLLGLGTRPGDWAVGIAAVPVADYPTAYADEMEALKSLDRTLFGGSPAEVPERYEASSPLTYVEQVTAPVYISAGTNDPRCPIRQIDNYVERLRALDKPHEVYRYDAGHGSLVVEERIKQVRLELAFALRHVGG